MRTLLDKRAVVTGAASGIGRAIARELASQGCHLYLIDIDETGLHETARLVFPDRVEVITSCCDVSQATETDACLDALLKHWPVLDVLVNNAGICFYGSTASTPQAVWDQVLAINLHASIRITKRLLPVLIERPEAHVLNVASMYGLFATNRAAAYHVSKFGLVGFSEALRAECGRSGVGVTALCPGFVDTGLFGAMKKRPESGTRRPPPWCCTTSENVARKAIRAIQRDRGIALVTLTAHFAYLAKRMFPSLLSGLYRIGRRRQSRARLDGGACVRANPAETQFQTGLRDVA